MDFEFSEDQKMLQTMVRDFAVKELEPVAAQIDEEARYPAENIKRRLRSGCSVSASPKNVVVVVVGKWKKPL